MRTLEELKAIDDGGSFDRLVKKMEEAANGVESLKLQLLTESVLGDFIGMHLRKPMEPKLLAVKEKETNFGVEFVDLNFSIPRKIRSKVPPPDVSNIQINNESVERCPFGVVVKEKEIVRKPAVKKQRKAGSLEKKRKADSYLETTKMKKKKTTNQLGLNPPPDLPQEFKDRIERLNGTNIMLVIQKELTATDMDTHQCRFAMPRGQVRSHDFLSEEEKHISRQKGLKHGVQCSLIQPSLEEITNLEFKRWDMTNTFSYTLIKNWNSVSYNTRNRLEIGSMVQLWSFRVGSNLWFALVKLKQEEEDRDTSTTGVTSI